MYIVWIAPEACDGCGKCILYCQDRVLGLVEIELSAPGQTRQAAAAVGNMMDCAGCNACVVVCPQEAVTVKEM